MDALCSAFGCCGCLVCSLLGCCGFLAQLLTPQRRTLEAPEGGLIAMGRTKDKVPKTLLRGATKLETEGGVDVVAQIVENFERRKRGLVYFKGLYTVPIFGYDPQTRKAYRSVARITGKTPKLSVLTPCGRWEEARTAETVELLHEATEVLKNSGRNSHSSRNSVNMRKKTGNTGSIGNSRRNSSSNSSRSSSPTNTNNAGGEAFYEEVDVASELRRLTKRMSVHPLVLKDCLCGILRWMQLPIELNDDALSDFTDSCGILIVVELLNKSEKRVYYMAQSSHDKFLLPFYSNSSVNGETVGGLVEISCHEDIKNLDISEMQRLGSSLWQVTSFSNICEIILQDTANKIEERVKKMNASERNINKEVDAPVDRDVSTMMKCMYDEHRALLLASNPPGEKSKCQEDKYQEDREVLLPSEKTQAEKSKSKVW